MEKVKFWKNTSSEFDKITSKDANTIYYLTDTGKIYLGEKMYGGTDMPFTIVSKDDNRFSSFDTLFLKGEHDGEFKLSVDPGVYCLADDMEFAFSAFIHLKDYIKFIYEGQSEDQLKDIVYKSTQCTLPKGSFIYITESFLEIYCTHTEVNTYGPGGGSNDEFSHCEAYIIGTYPVALDDNEHVFGLLEFDNIEHDMEDGILTYSFEYAMMNAEGFKEGDTLVVTNNSGDDSHSWSGPKFKIGSAGVQATQITDHNYTNYQTMDQWLALNDGMYLVNTDKLSINVVGKNKVYSASSAGFCALLGIEENYNKSLSIPKGNYISVYTTEAGGSSYYKYKMMVIYQIEANPDSESKNRPSAGEAVIITLGAQPGNSPEGSSFTKSIEVYDFNESLMLLSVTNNYVNLIFTPLTSPDTIPKAGQLAQWEGDADSGFKLKGVDFPSGSVIPTFEVNDANVANYDSLEKWFAVDDGVYYINTTNTYGNNGGYIDVPKLKKVSFVGTGFTSGSSGASTKTIEDGVISLLNGATVYVNTNSYADGHIEKFVQFNSVYVSGDISEYVLFRKMKSNTYNSANVYFIDILTNLSISGQMMEEIIPMLGADGMFPNMITEDDALTSYDTLQSWMNLDPGRYLVMRSDLTVEVSATDACKSTDNSFTRTLSIPKNTFVFVYSTDDSNSSATNYKNVVFQKADNMPSGYYGEWMTFKWDSRTTYSADNVELYPLMTAAMNGSASVAIVDELSSVVDTKVDAEYVTNATKNLATKQSVLDVKDLANRHYTAVLRILGSTDDSAQVLPKLNTTDKSNIVAAINELDARHDKFQENENTSVVLNNHTEYRCKVMASLHLSLPETIPDDYNSRIVFESGETATTLSYTAGSIKFTGDDCDSSNAFVPAANTSYEVNIKYLGLDSLGNKRIIARVGAF